MPALLLQNLLLLLHVFTGGAQSEPCSNSPPQPTSVGASASSYDSITVFWQKPFGSGYSYKVTVINGTTKEGNLDNSTAGSVSINELQPETNYTVQVQLACDNNPSTFSTAETTYVKTLKAGKKFLENAGSLLICSITNL